MKLLVFGKTGQVARELVHCRPDAMFLSRQDVDLTDAAACKTTIAQHGPDVVINAAAYTAVDRAEDEEALAMRINADAPGAMAEACAKRYIPFLHISTDYVFDGSGEAPWTPDAATAPLGAYGRSKLAGEKAVVAAGGLYAILRTAWVFSAHGNNFVKTMLHLSQTRDRLTIVADQVGCPTPASDIATTLLALAQALQNGQGGGLYHYGGAPSVSWADFAREIFAQAGKAVAVQNISSAEYPTRAARPHNSRLDCSRLEEELSIRPADWKSGLRSVLKELTA